MGDLRTLHLRLVNALLAIAAIVLPLISHYWPHRVPPVAAVAICIGFIGLIVQHARGRVATPRAAMILVTSLGGLVTVGSLLHLMSATSPADAFAGEAHNASRALILFTGAAYVVLGRRNGRRAALTTLAIWALLNLMVIQQFRLMDLISAEVLIPMLDVVATTGLVGLLFDVAALNARHLERERRSAHRLAQVDALTGVSNRHGVLPAMEAAVEAPGEAALIVLDLDHFKQINDLHGHDGGDRILRQVGRALRRFARDGDAVGRWGGEEFVVVLPGGGRDAAERVSRQLRTAMHEIRADQPVTASFGITVARHLDTVETMFKRADRALYKAKEDGRDRIVVCLDDGSMAPLANRRDVNRAALVRAAVDPALRN